MFNKNKFEKYMLIYLFVAMKIYFQIKNARKIPKQIKNIFDMFSSCFCEYLFVSQQIFYR